MLSSAKISAAPSYEALRQRIDRLFFRGAANFTCDNQMSLPGLTRSVPSLMFPGDDIGDFMDFIAASLPDKEIYLFGGVIRDLALFGRRGFDSDIDIVVEGGIDRLARVLDRLGARQNKFGGYRFFVGDWPVDIWAAEDTWAIKQGLVSYRGVQSLTKTTVLNWDAVLMSWRNRSFVCDSNYLTLLSGRVLDVVLESNPNPMGMAVRVFRHLSTKEARKIGISALAYLERCTEIFSYEQLVQAEIRSYGATLIEPALYRFFSVSNRLNGAAPERFDAAVHNFVKSGFGVSWGQLQLNLDDNDEF